MKLIIILLSINIFLHIPHLIYTQNSDKGSEHLVEKSSFINFSFGTQMSGIKDEDFILSNYSPLFQLNAGKWFTPFMALQIGYKGYYFRYIGDQDRHPYYFLYGEAIFNLNRMFLKKSIGSKWDFLLHGGAGYFYNEYYERPNICANTGFQTTLMLNETLRMNWDISAIMGWDIYQGNKDILPGTTLGIVYSF